MFDEDKGNVLSRTLTSSLADEVISFNPSIFGLTADLISGRCHEPGQRRRITPGSPVQSNRTLNHIRINGIFSSATLNTKIKKWIVAEKMFPWSYFT